MESLLFSETSQTGILGENIQSINTQGIDTFAQNQSFRSSQQAILPVEIQPISLSETSVNSHSLSSPVLENNNTPVA